MDSPNYGFFARFTPGCFALFTEAFLLQHKLDRMTGIEGGFFWAAVRAIHRGEASCPPLASLASIQIEQSYSKIYRKVSELPGRSRPPSLREDEMNHCSNTPILSPGRPEKWGTRIPPSGPITVGLVLADTFAKFDYRHGANAPLWYAGIDVHELVTSLETGAYTEHNALALRGTVPPGSQRLYDLACAKATQVYNWAVRDMHIAAAQHELGGGGDRALLDEYGEWVDDTADHGPEYEKLRFPGPLPWAPSACEALGVTPPLRA